MNRVLLTCLCVATAIATHASQPTSQEKKGERADLTARENPETATDTPILGTLIGLWDVLLVNRNRDGSWSDEERHHLWRWYSILDGHAIQDDWISFDDDAEGDSPPPPRVTGTNIRIYNPEEKEWFMAWIDTRSRRLATFTAVNRGGAVVMTGHNAQGRLLRITFSNITGQTFEWTQEWTSDEGETWFPVAKMQCRRLK